MKQAGKSRGGRPWSFDREAAIETAMTLFWRHGYEGVSVGDLTKAIGIAPPSLYAAFGSKAGLYALAMDRYTNTFGCLTDLDIESEETLSAAVRLLLESAVRTVTHRERERGCMISSGLVASHPDLADLAEEAAMRREGLRERVAQSLQRFGPEEEIRRLSRYLLAVMQGISVQARDGVDAAQLQEIVDAVVTGLAAESPESKTANGK
ncbi:TetR/AcrR family transcriptional regulator [Pacificispira sp.]|uniref:TetR/AcrR family transcriptional regulator n=1 Tax=Pacificispira sp. TaxID=2888761 RepID=UPI003B517F6E